MKYPLIRICKVDDTKVKLLIRSTLDQSQSSNLNQINIALGPKVKNYTTQRR